MGKSNDIYSAEKSSYWPSHFDLLREGRQPHPIHVQLILSDLCNQDCNFCLTEDTVIDTLSGPVSISKIKLGDRIYGPDGRSCTVGQIGSRRVAQVFQIRVGGKEIKATAEHPILTQDGWKKAGDLSRSDCAVVQVRVRKACQSIDYKKLHIAGIELDGDLELRPIDSISVINKEYRVYNFSCLPSESYIANGIVVHNCAYRMSGYTSNQLFNEGENHNPKRFIPTEKAKEILRDCQKLGVKAVQFTGGGEPTVHPDFLEILKFAHFLDLKTALVSNGILITKRKMEHELLKCSWLRFSVDAAEVKTYSEIRRVPESHFSEVRKTIETIRKLRDDVNKADPVIGFGFVVTKDNYHEVFKACENAKKWGADNVRISGVFTSEGVDYFKGFKKQALILARHAKLFLEDENFKVYDRLPEKIEDLDQGKPDYSFCGYQHFTTYIGGDQNIYRCCVYAYNERGKVGSLKDQSLYDFWGSREKENKMSREGFDARGCERCQFNDRNRAINSMISIPKHVEFV